MPFWKRKTDPEVEAARAGAEAALPPGWSIHRSDRETFSLPTGRVTTYGISAGGPAGEKALVLAVGEANAYRHFARLMRGELDTAEGWAIPLDNIEAFKTHGLFDIIDDDDPDVLAAKQELDEDYLTVGSYTTPIGRRTSFQRASSRHAQLRHGVPVAKRSS